jgi:xanthine dehydrogenase YagT iron-sulfur-binding subunit
VSSKKKPEPEPAPGVSRRGFIRGVGIGSGALGAGLLEQAAEAQPQTARVAGPGPVPITLQVNGKPLKLNVEPRVTLIDALRNHLNHTGAKRACDRGGCGSCTVLLGGKAVYSCTVLAIEAQGKPIQTVEGLSAGAEVHPLVSAFVEEDGLQCGYCTPGMVMASKALLDRDPNPTLEDVHAGLAGNYCRCGSYIGIRKAVLAASKQMKGGRRG